MAFDFKKEYKEFYMPARKPALVSVPPMNYVAVRGKGDPNQEGSEYKRSIDLLYGIAYTIKMSKDRNECDIMYNRPNQPTLRLTGNIVPLAKADIFRRSNPM